MKPIIDGSKYTSTGEELLARIQDYLVHGGMFNPEMMDHDKVRDLILDCQDYISALTKK